MNEQLQQALADLIQKSMSAAGDALAFAQEELPDVIQQLLMWKAVESIFLFILVCACGYISVASALRAYKMGNDAPERTYHNHNECNKIDGQISTMMLLSVTSGFLVLLSVLINQAPDFIQILAAPKIYLLEYAANLAK